MAPLVLGFSNTLPALSFSSGFLSPALPTPADVNSGFHAALPMFYPIPIPSLHSALSQLDHKTHKTVNAITAQVQDGKVIRASHMRHICVYKKYCAAEEQCPIQDDLTGTPILAYPIMAGKAAMFLLYET